MVPGLTAEKAVYEVRGVRDPLSVVRSLVFQVPADGRDPTGARGQALMSRLQAVRRSEFRGTCQICFSAQKLPHGVLSFHGYKRPGTGETYGRCPGMDFPPYEVSCERTKWWMLYNEKELHGLEAHLANLQARPDVLQYEVRSYRLSKPYVIAVPRSDSYEYTKDANGISIPPYRQVLSTAIYSAEGRIRQSKSYIESLMAKIDDWKVRPLTAVPTEEMMLVVKRTKAEVLAKIRELKDQDSVLYRKAQEAEDAYYKTHYEDHHYVGTKTENARAAWAVIKKIRDERKVIKQRIKELRQQGKA